MESRKVSGQVCNPWRLWFELQPKPNCHCGEYQCQSWTSGISLVKLCNAGHVRQSHAKPRYRIRHIERSKFNQWLSGKPQYDCQLRSEWIASTEWIRNRPRECKR